MWNKLEMLFNYNALGEACQWHYYLLMAMGLAPAVAGYSEARIVTEPPVKRTGRLSTSRQRTFMSRLVPASRCPPSGSNSSALSVRSDR